MIYPVDKCISYSTNHPINIEWRIVFNLIFNKELYEILLEGENVDRRRRGDRMNIIITILTPDKCSYSYNIFYLDGGPGGEGIFRIWSDDKRWYDSEFIDKEHLSKYLLADNFWEIGQEWGKQNSNEYIIESKNYRNLSFTLKSDGSNIHIDLIED